METNSGDNGNWLQWLIGIVITAYGAGLAYMASEISKIKDNQQTVEENISTKTSKEDDSIWHSLDNLREKVEALASRTELQQMRLSLEEDRRMVAKTNAEIAEKMVTRSELDRQLDQHFSRLLIELRARKIHD